MKLFLLYILGFILGFLIGNHLGYIQGGECVIGLLRDKINQNKIKDVSK